MQFRSTSLFVRGIGVLVLVAACGTGAMPGSTRAAQSYPPPIPANQKVTIRFADYNLASAGVGQSGTLQLLKEFEQLHPNIHVVGEPLVSTAIVAKVQAEVVAGNQPDVAQLTFSDLDFIVHNLNAVPLNDIASPADIAAWAGGKYPFSPAALKLAAIDGKTYGAPFTFSTPTLFYNSSLFKAAGLNPSNPPATWAQVKADALQIKQKTGKVGVSIDCLGQFDWCYQSLVLSAGGRVLSPDRTKLTFAEPAAVSAVQMWQDLVQSGASASLTQTENFTDFGSGSMGMLLETSATQSMFLGESQGKWDLRAAREPAFGSLPVMPTNSGSALFVLSHDPLKERAAWELIQFLTSARGYTIITSKIGYLPLRPGIVNDPLYLKSWAQAHPLVQPNLAQLAVLQPWVSFPGPNYHEVVTIMMQAVEQVVYHGADATKTLQTAQQQASAFMPK
jgi:multiple sugar transport system substrate-binding protein